MDFLNELESLAEVATRQSEQPDEPCHNDIKRWQSLFGLSYSQALQEIQNHRSDLSRPRVSESHWEIVRAEKEAQGFDKEAYLLRLEGPIENVEVVKLRAKLKHHPQIYRGTDDDDKPATFPTFIPYSIAAKELSTTSAYPTLGIDATMPQYRLSSADDPALVPSQIQYPVWYFFYGTLADPVVLGRLLGVEPSYKDATVHRGILKTWGGKYKALVNIPGKIVHGNAFLVQDQAQEEALRCYETKKYEVVTCELNIGGNKVKGLTFRFAGDI
ncbi:hypothetical protein GGR58DRAFT_518840 [Xylaria digitata]|nr:hypothetical protein GGR58DRAFT_518840 [Xylaria digitata]